MVTLTTEGVYHRTKVMDLERAGRFARCIRANTARFQGVTIETSPRAKGDARFYVQYAPAREARSEELLCRQQDQRQVKALTEGQGYTFCPDGERPFHWCLSVSGEVYEVTEHSCTCPDFVFRSGPAGLKCKHVIALAAGVGTVARF